MKVGKFGVRLWCYAVAAFIFGVLDLYLGVLAVAAFAIIAEKDEWLNNQVIQALLLYLVYCLVILVADWSIGGLAKLLNLLKQYDAASLISKIVSIIKDIIFVAYIVFVIIAIFRCISGKDGAPYFSKASQKMLSITNKDGEQPQADKKQKENKKEKIETAKEENDTNENKSE